MRIATVCRVAVLGVVLLASLLGMGRVQAVHAQPRFNSRPAPQAKTSCITEPQQFETREGPVAYCRGHLRYEPGALDCYTLAQQVCLVLEPFSQTWSEQREELRSEVFPCPEGPKPPVCPRLR